jgi:hypothetical protein
MKERAMTDKIAREGHIKVMATVKNGHITVRTIREEITNAVRVHKVITLNHQEIIPDREETTPDRKGIMSDARIIMVRDHKDHMTTHKDNRMGIRTTPQPRMTATAL